MKRVNKYDRKVVILKSKWTLIGAILLIFGTVYIGNAYDILPTKDESPRYKNGTYQIERGCWVYYDRLPDLDGNVNMISEFEEWAWPYLWEKGYLNLLCLPGPSPTPIPSPTTIY